MIKLNESGVVFVADTHTYTLEGRELQGITGMIHEQLFPDTYNGISEAVLHKAAEHGTLIHQLCELYDELGVISDEPQAKAYIDLCKGNGLKHLASEYLVTDYENHATAIDKVFEAGEGRVHLADIKTTSELYEDSVSWQLSIGKYFFNLVNPDVEVDKFFAIWLPKSGEPMIKEVKEIPQEEVKYLLMAEDSGAKYTIPDSLVNINSKFPSQFCDMENEIFTRLSMIAKLEKEAEKFKKMLSDAMEQANAVKWKSDRMTISRTKDSVTRTLDSKRLKEELPDIYNQYLKESKRKGSLRITLTE